MVSERQAQAQLDALAKPRGSLGRMEALARRLAVRQGTLAPRVRPRELVLFAGDHGVVASGVSAWPSDVTALMVRTIVAGRSVSAAWARLHDCPLRVVDVGVAACLDDLAADHFRAARVASGTDDLSCGPAMSVAAFDAAWEVGASEARAALARGCRVLLAGEMGIGNTTAAAALCARALGGDAGDWVGPGTGLGAEGVQRKRAVIEAALACHADAPDTPFETLRRLGGREIAAMAGAILRARQLRVPVVLDGFVCCAALAPLAVAAPDIVEHCIAGHCSAEPGHGRLLARLGLDPLLHLGMRLGEGSGAAVAVQIIRAAIATHGRMATFAEAGIGA